MTTQLSRSAAISSVTPLVARLDLAIVLGIFAAILAGAYATGTLAFAPVAVVVGAAAAVIVVRRRAEPISVLGLRRASWWRTILLGVGATLATMLLATPANLLVQRLLGAPNLSAFSGLEGNTPRLLQFLALSWTTAAIGEELLFRGFVLGRLERALGGSQSALAGALLLQAALFGVSHAYQGPSGMIGTGVIGLLLGAAYLLTRRNLWVVILAHGLIDTIGFLAFYTGAFPAGAEGAPAVIL